MFRLAFLALALALAASASAFVAPSSSRTRVSPLRVANGWQPDESKFAWGLPGSIDPVPEFDPLNFAKDASLGQMKRYREAEVTHGRVAMLSVVGFLVAESFHPLFGGQIIGPAIYHLTEVRKITPEFFELLAVSIGIVETSRAQIGWIPPPERKGGEFLRDNYYPGDIGFDPLGLKPSDPEEFAAMQTKELQNGRLAMLASMGFILQELTNQKGILENLFA